MWEGLLRTSIPDYKCLPFIAQLYEQDIIVRLSSHQEVTLVFSYSTNCNGVNENEPREIDHVCLLRCVATTYVMRSERKLSKEWTNEPSSAFSNKTITQHFGGVQYPTVCYPSKTIEDEPCVTVTWMQCPSWVLNDPRLLKNHPDVWTGTAWMEKRHDWLSLGVKMHKRAD